MWHRNHLFLAIKAHEQWGGGVILDVEATVTSEGYSFWEKGLTNVKLGQQGLG